MKEKTTGDCPDDSPPIDGKIVLLLLPLILLCCAALAAIFLTGPGGKTGDPPTVYAGMKLSALSEEECVAFVRDSGIEVPPGLENDGLGGLVKTLFASFEEHPYEPSVFSDSEAVAFAERLRPAVIRHCGYPWLPAGVYAFDENLYTTPVSSYFPFNGTGLLYCVGEDFYVTADEASFEEKSAVSFDCWVVREIPADIWEREDYLFPPQIDLKRYTTRLSFAGKGMVPNTALYLMDDEVWLVKGGDSFSPIAVWSIYRLKLTDLPLADFAPES